MNSFKPLRSEKFAQEIANQIKKSIFDGTYESGDKLPSESDMATLFRVSKVTIRQAVRILENSGILFTRQGAEGGIFVSEADSSFVSSFLSDMLKLKRVTPSDLTMTRLIFEPDIAALVARIWKNDDLDEVRENILQAKIAYKKGRLDEARVHNLTFHRLICDITKNPVIIFSLNSVIDVLEENVLILKLDKNFVLNEINSHKAILDNIEARKVEQSYKLMRQHVTDVHERLESKHRMGDREISEKRKTGQR